jgi:hypothetical protein
MSPTVRGFVGRFAWRIRALRQLLFKRYSALISASGCDGPAVVAPFPGVKDAVIYRVAVFCLPVRVVDILHRLKAVDSLGR